jgi:hypothetical protein
MDNAESEKTGQMDASRRSMWISIVLLLLCISSIGHGIVLRCYNGRIDRLETKINQLEAKCIALEFSHVGNGKGEKSKREGNGDDEEESGIVIGGNDVKEGGEAEKAANGERVGEGRTNG